MSIDIEGSRPLTAEELRAAAEASTFSAVGGISVGLSHFFEGVESGEADEGYEDDYTEETLRQTTAIREFLDSRTKSTKDLIYWHMAANPKATEEEIEALMENLAEDTISAIIEHTDWLHDQGLTVCFQPDEESVLPMVGLEYGEGGLTVQTFNPSTQEVLVCPMASSEQFVVL